MPPINNYVCNVCKINFHTGWGGYEYVESPEGERIPCPHPGEDSTIAEVLNIDYEDISQVRYKEPRWWWSRRRRKIEQLIQDKTGFHSFFVCLNCKKSSYHNVRKDKLQCTGLPKFRSSDKIGLGRSKMSLVCGRDNQRNSHRGGVLIKIYYLDG